MCGIAGAVGFIDDTIQTAVRAMNGVQIHRGPDGEGFWSDVPKGSFSSHGVVLSHRRLSILDLSEAGTQPMHDQATGSALVYNGEVYNYRELREGLNNRGYQFVSNCDTEVVLKALILDGCDALNTFNGMFGFAFWDSKKKSLILGRDRLGIKPLYYTKINRGQDRTTVLFASELRSLLASNLVNRNIETEGLDSYLWNGFVVGPTTIVKGVFLQPAGTTITMDAGSLSTSSEAYWNLQSKPEGHTSSLDEVRDAFESAVSLRLISDVPLGIFLSGGVDSSAVVAAAVKISSNSIHTFNIGFPEIEFDESEYATNVAHQLGTEHHSIQLTEADFQSGLSGALQAIDQPTFCGINSYFVSKAVREAGVTVALAGTGGDELFGGYTSFADLPGATRVSRWLNRFPENILRSTADIITKLKVGPFGVIPPQTRWGKLGDLLMARGSLVDSYQVSYSIYTQSLLNELRSGQYNLSYGLPSERRTVFKSSLEGVELFKSISQMELSCFITERLLRDTDAASMAVSLEVRVPLLDHQLIETVLRLPSDIRYLPLGKKKVLRDIALYQFSPETFNRPKSGFVLPFELWLRRGLGKLVKETLYDKELCQSVGLNSNMVRNIWQAFEDNSPGLYWSRIWTIYVLLYWCRVHRMML